MIKVLHVGLSSNQGGIENVVYSWYKNKPDDIQFDFINVEEHNLAYQSNFEQKGEIFRIVARKKNPIIYARKLKAILAEGKYDYVHCHVMALTNPEPIIWASQYENIVPIIHSHSVIKKENLDNKDILLHLIGKWRLRNIKYFRMACGHDAGEAMFGGQDFMTIENGVDFDKLAFSIQARSNLRKYYGISQEAFVLGHVGRHGSVKNYPFLLEVFSNIYKKNENARLLLIGDVDKDDEVNNLVSEFGLEKAVIFTGGVDCTYGFYSVMDAFCLPSIYEGVSVALIEAQAAGLKCVVSENIARESAISNNVDFVSINDMHAYVEKITEIMGAPYSRDNVEIEKNMTLR